MIDYWTEHRTLKNKPVEVLATTRYPQGICPVHADTTANCHGGLCRTRRAWLADVQHDYERFWQDRGLA